jgi:hypothetical protein
MKVHGGVALKSELIRPQHRVLASENDPGPAAAGGQPMCDGSHLDCFGPGADHQPYIGITQPSP